MTARNVEAEAAAICAGIWLLDQYSLRLAPSSTTLTPDQVNNHFTRFGWIVDHLMKDAAALADAVWGEGEGARYMADDLCEPVEQQDAA